MLKASFKTLEGQSLGGVLIGGLALLYPVLTGDSEPIPLEQIMEHAETAKDIAEIYAQSAKDADLKGLVGLGKAGVILVFMYKMYSKFTDSRTKLKTTELGGSPIE